MDLRRRMMLARSESRWAKEPLIVFEISGTTWSTITMNGAYSDSNLTKNTFSGSQGGYTLRNKKTALYFEDVTKYKKLSITGNWSDASTEGQASIGLLKNEFYGTISSYDVDDGDFAVGQKVGVTTTANRTYSFDIANLSGKQMLYQRCHFVFSNGNASDFTMKKVILE